MKQEYLNANEELNLKRERMKECNVQISALVAAQGDLSQKLADLSLQAKRLDNEVFVLIHLSCKYKFSWHSFPQ